MDAVANFAYSTVSVAPSPVKTGTTMTIVSGAVMPAVPFNLVIWPVGEIPLPTTAEVVRVTANAAGALTVTRKSEPGGIARSVLVGDQVMAAITASMFESLGAVATKPAVAGEGLVTTGAAGIDRLVVSCLTGNALLTKFKVKHGLGTRSVQVSVQTNVGGNPGEITAVKKVEAINTEEVEVEFAAAPPKGTSYWVKVEG